MSTFRNSSFLRATLIYGLAFTIAGLTPIALLPVLTRVLTVEEYGIISSFLIFVVLVGNLAGLGANGFLPVRFFKDEPGTFGVSAWTAIVSVSAAHIVALLILAIFTVLEFETGLTFELLMLAGLVAFVSVLNIIFLAISQASGRPFRYFAIRLLQSLIEISFCLLFLEYLFADSNARIYSYALAIVAAASLGFFFCWSSGYITFQFGKSQFRRLLHFGLPLMPHIIAGTAVLFAERSIILATLGTQALGIYMSAMQIGMAMLFLIEPINKAFAPWLFKQLSNDNPHTKYRIVVHTYVFFALLIAGGIALNLLSFVFFEDIVGKEFHQAKSIVPYLVFGFVFQGMYYAVTNYVFFAERTAKLSMTTVSVSIVGAIISLSFIHRNGLAGAGIGFLLTNALLFASVWYLSSRCVPMPWSLRRGVADG